MKKLTMDAFEMKAQAVTSDELLNTISGGTNNSCHKPEPKKKELTKAEAAMFWIYANFPF